MKRLRYIFAFLFTLSTLLTLASCSGEAPDNSFMTVSQKVINFTEIGETAPLVAEIFTTDENAVPTWSTSNPDVAVYENGTVRSTGYGTCVIRASYGKMSAACTVYLENPYTSLKLSSERFDFNSIGAISSISAYAGDTNLTGIAKWSSSSPAIAEVNQNGVITTHGYGVCLITARIDSKTASAAIIVTDPDERDLALSQTELQINPGEEYTLSAEAKNHTPEKITWYSSNEDVLECENGKITAKKAGICAVVAVSSLGASDYCVVTVDDPPEPPAIDPLKLIFTMPELPLEIHTVDGETGKILASAVVTSYTVVPDLDEETGRLYLQIYYHCVKTFDANGADGTSSVHFATNLYRENDTHCERRLYKRHSLHIGDEFTVTCSLFSVQTQPDVCRTFYMTIESACEV